jgi:hypothetical protein
VSTVSTRALNIAALGISLAQNGTSHHLASSATCAQSASLCTIRTDWVGAMLNRASVLRPRSVCHGRS